MALDYPNYVNTLADLLVILPTITNPALANPSTDTNFNVILPQAIAYMENRMYRELDLLQTNTSESVLCDTNIRSVVKPSDLIVMNACYIITPAGANASDVGAKRNPMIRTSLDYVNTMYDYGGATIAGRLPKYFATNSENTIQIGPAPNARYNIEFYGTYRPAPLSATNTTTILGNYLPDMMVSCSMVFLSGYQRDYGAMSDDPKLAQSWENQYQIQKASAVAEIARAKQAGAQWQPYSTPSSATATTRGSPQ